MLVNYEPHSSSFPLIGKEGLRVDRLLTHHVSSPFLRIILTRQWEVRDLNPRGLRNGFTVHPIQPGSGNLPLGRLTRIELAYPVGYRDHNPARIPFPPQPP